MIALVLDTETTGLISNPEMRLDRQPEVIELYACLADLDSGEVFREIDRLIAPRVRPISDKVYAVTGIRDSDLDGKWPFGDVVPELTAMMAEAEVAVAHNASFDRDAIDFEMRRLGRAAPWPRLVCTVEQTVHLKGYRMSLADLCLEMTGQEHRDAHRARADGEALLRCCLVMRRRGLL